MPQSGSVFGPLLTFIPWGPTALGFGSLFSSQNVGVEREKGACWRLQVARGPLENSPLISNLGLLHSAA